nr:hypothetical protein CKG001_14660 [Bdellovibrio sp. CKG001]
MKIDKALYESSEVWDQSLQKGQANLIQAIIDFWPPDVKNVLDVGCGDGKITHALSNLTKAEFTGLDSSSEALSRLNINRIDGTADQLPFPDNSFDLVMTTDVFEHLPDEVESKAWKELFRVSRKWVLVVVPFRENLSDATTTCPNCGYRYHVNHHLRSYDFENIYQHVNDEWVIQHTVLSGESWSPMLPMETEFRRAIFEEYSGWDSSICPNCHHKGSKADDSKQLSKLTAASLGKQIYKDLEKNRYHRSHSEIMTVFSKGDCSKYSAPIKIRPAIFKQQASNIDFNVQKPTNNLVPFPQVSQVVHGADQGYVIQLPVYDSNLLSMSFVRSNSHANMEIKISIEDGIGLLFSGVALLAGEFEKTLHFHRPVSVGYYGALVRVSTIDSLKSIQFGHSPEVYWVTPEGNGASYIHIEKNDVFLQFFESSWFDAKALDQLHHRQEPKKWNWYEVITDIERGAELNREKSHYAKDSLKLQSDFDSLLSSYNSIYEKSKFIEARVGRRIRAIVKRVLRLVKL